MTGHVTHTGKAKSVAPIPRRARDEPTTRSVADHEDSLAFARAVMIAAPLGLAGWGLLALALYIAL